MRDEVQQKIKAVRDALATDNTAQLQSAADELERTMQRVGQEIYSHAGAGVSNSPTSSGPASNPEPGAVEGEV